MALSIPRFGQIQAADTSGIGGFFNQMGNIGDDAASADVYNKLNAHKATNPETTQRDMLGYLNSLGIRESVANRGKANIADMFKQTEAEQAAAEAQANKAEAYQKHLLATALQTQKSTANLDLQKLLEGGRNSRNITDNKESLARTNILAASRKKGNKDYQGTLAGAMKADPTIQAMYEGDPLDSARPKINNFLSENLKGYNNNQIAAFLNQVQQDSEAGTNLPSWFDPVFNNDAWGKVLNKFKAQQPLSTE